MEKYDFIINDFLKICPEFEVRWVEHLSDWEGNDENRGIYNDMAEIARFIVDLFEIEKTESFKEIFSNVEKYMNNEDAELVGVIKVGLLEDIQTIASNRDFGHNVFEKWLKPKSKQAWDDIERIWNGKGSLMDFIRSEIKQEDEKK